MLLEIAALGTAGLTGAGLSKLFPQKPLDEQQIELKHEVETLKAEKQRLKEQHQKAIAMLEERRSRSRTEEQEHEKEIEAQKEKLASIKEEIEKAEQEKQAIRESMDESHLLNRVDSLDKALSEINQEYASLQEKLEKEQKRTSHLRSQFNKIESERDELYSELSIEKDRVFYQKNQIERLTQERDFRYEQVVVFVRKLEELGIHEFYSGSTLHSWNINADEAIKDIQKQKQKNENRIKVLRNQNKSQRGKLKELRDQVVEQDEEIESLYELLKQARDKNKFLQQHLADAVSKLAIDSDVTQQGETEDTESDSRWAKFLYVLLRLWQGIALLQAIGDGTMLLELLGSGETIDIAAASHIGTDLIIRLDDVIELDQNCQELANEEQEQSEDSLKSEAGANFKEEQAVTQLT